MQLQAIKSNWTLKKKIWFFGAKSAATANKALIVKCKNTFYIGGTAEAENAGNFMRSQPQWSGTDSLPAICYSSIDLIGTRKKANAACKFPFGKRQNLHTTDSEA